MASDPCRFGIDSLSTVAAQRSWATVQAERFESIAPLDVGCITTNRASFDFRDNPAIASSSSVDTTPSPSPSDCAHPIPSLQVMPTAFVAQWPSFPLTVFVISVHVSRLPGQTFTPRMPPRGSHDWSGSRPRTTAAMPPPPIFASLVAHISNPMVVGPMWKRYGWNAKGPAARRQYGVRSANSEVDRDCALRSAWLVAGSLLHAN